MLFATDPKDRIENNPEALQKLAYLFDPSWLKLQADLISDTCNACFAPMLEAIKNAQSLRLPTFYIPTFPSPTLSLLSDTEDEVYEDEEIIQELTETRDDCIPILGAVPKSWQSVAIQFLDQERVRIIYPGLKGDLIMTYKDMGFADKRKIDTPDQNWKFLRALALGSGQIDWGDKNANFSVKKKKQSVKDRLCSLFKLEEDPFERYSKKSGYILKLVLLPDNEGF